MGSCDAMNQCRSWLLSAGWWVAVIKFQVRGISRLGCGVNVTLTVQDPLATVAGMWVV